MCVITWHGDNRTPYLVILPNMQKAHSEEHPSSIAHFAFTGFDFDLRSRLVLGDAS